MKQYLKLVKFILERGEEKEDRTGTGTLSVFGYQMRFNLLKGFPLVSTKKVHLKSIIHEVIWFLSGDTNIRYLQENGVSIWNEWSATESEFGDSLEGRKLVYVKPRYVENTGPYTVVADSDGSDLHNQLRGTWERMLSRCYDKNAHNYRYYGARGVFVCERWHTLSKFVEDVQTLPNWKSKLADWDNYNLDKDYYSSNCYSPDTCLWLSKMENGIYGAASALIAISPDGHAEVYPSVNRAAEALNIKRTTLHRFGSRVPDILKGRNKVLKGWKFIILDEPFRYDFKKVGDLGPVYGSQWRNWGAGLVDANMVNTLVEQHVDNPIALANGLLQLFKDRDKNGIDQISNVIHTLKTNPDSRRIIVSAWNPAQVDDMALPPCHALFQFYTSKLSVDERYTLYREKMDRWQLEINRRACDNPEDALANMYTNLHIHPRIWFKNDESGHQQLDKEGIPRRKLSCQLYQRSADVGLGVPFNIASYALLTQMLAQVVGMAPGDFIWTGGDVHIYQNHIEGLKEQLTREPHKLPKLWLNPDVKDLFAFTFDDIRVEGYASHPHIKLEVAI